MRIKRGIYIVVGCIGVGLGAIGAVIPLVNGRLGGEKGQAYRNSFGSLNTCVLDNLYGLEEILEYGQQEVRLKNLKERTKELGELTGTLKKDENRQRVMTDGVILFAGIAMALLCAQLVACGSMSGAYAVIAVIAMTSSFGPTAALSALSNNLHHTLASGNRVLDILEETPVVEDVVDGKEACEGEIVCESASFSYDDLGVLQDFNATFEENTIHGIVGKSGCGKSTLLKLLMRFYETDKGNVPFYGYD